MEDDGQDLEDDLIIPAECVVAMCIMNRSEKTKQRQLESFVSKSHLTHKLHSYLCKIVSLI